uniref:DED domain-containing protein n=1 Tax=Hucho hucho TaxID=62062 RepID=A0A4W5KD31_9TELE
MAKGQLYQMIKRICDDLSSGECRRLLYLCGSLDTDNCGSDHVRDVLTSWLSRGPVGQLDLVELLFRLRRFDLLKKEFHISKQEVEGILGQNQALSDKYIPWMLMSDVSEDIGTEDLESLKFLLSGSLSRERLTSVKVKACFRHFTLYFITDKPDLIMGYRHRVNVETIYRGYRYRVNVETLPCEMQGAKFKIQKLNY